MAVQRILLGHALIAAFGGIPLIYMGDELALLNDYGYLDEPDHAHDSRWIHRPRMDWALAAARETADTPSARVFRGTRHILAGGAATPALHGGYPDARFCGRMMPGSSPSSGWRRPGRCWACSTFAEDWQQPAGRLGAGAGGDAAA